MKIITYIGRKRNMNNQIPELRKDLESKLSSRRYEHSLSVSYTCISLAMKYGYPLDRAELAGLLHDCAKMYNDETILIQCINHHVVVTETEQKAPAVLHAKYGAWMVKHEYHVNDEEICSAIACHTTGKPNMSLLDKILYVADYIEPRRYKADHLDTIRRLAYEDLDETLYQIMENILCYLEKQGDFIDPMTREAYTYYQALRRATKGV